MCHRGAGVNMSLCCRPYLTIPTKIRPPRRTNQLTQEAREVEQEERNDSTDVLFIYSSSLAILLSSFQAHKKQPALSFSVSANVICRSVTEMVQERKDVFSDGI